MIKQSIEIVIPAYNEEENIKIVVEKSLSWLKKQTKNYLVTVVDDGSSDNTGKILDLLAKEKSKLKVIHHNHNLGIGNSWFDLYKNTTKDIIFTCPADQQFDPMDFSLALPYVKNSDIVSIFRRKKKQYGVFNSILSNLNKEFIYFLFGFKVRDVNWVKMYKKNVLKDLNPELKSPLIETELLAKAKKRNLSIVEIEAPHYPRKYGKAKGHNLKQIFLTLREIASLYYIVKKFK